MPSKIFLNQKQLKKIINYLENGDCPELPINLLKSFKKRSKLFKFEDNKIFIRQPSLGFVRFLTTEEIELKRMLIANIHDQNGHPGRDRLHNLAKSMFLK